MNRHFHLRVCLCVSCEISEYVDTIVTYRFNRLVPVMKTHWVLCEGKEINFYTISINIHNHSCLICK